MFIKLSGSGGIEPPEPRSAALRPRLTAAILRHALGAVQSLQALREGAGEFSSPEEFYRFWRRYPFRIGAAVQRQLDRLLAASEEE